MDLCAFVTTPKLVMIPNSESLDEVSSYEFTTLIDTDGKELTPSNYTCVAEDKDGYIWVGTNRGAVYFTKPRSLPLRIKPLHVVQG